MGTLHSEAFLGLTWLQVAIATGVVLIGFNVYKSFSSRRAATKEILKRCTKCTWTGKVVGMKKVCPKCAGVLEAS